MFEILNEIHDSTEWDRVLEAFEFVPPGQASSWSGSPSFRGHEVLRFTSNIPGAVAVQGALKRSLGFTRFVVQDGPIFGKACDEQTLIDFIAVLRERLGKACVLSFSCVQPYEPSRELQLRRAGCQRPWSGVCSPLTLYADCSDNARVEENFSPDWRKNIRKAEKKGLLFEAVGFTSDHACEDFYALYSATCQIKGIKGDIDLPMLEAFGRDSRWQVFFASLGGERVSARLVFISGTTAFDFAAGTSVEGRKLSASHFLAASLLKRLGESGVRSYDFGRIGPGRYDSIDHFKHGSGGRAVAYLGEWSLSSRPWLELALGVVRYSKSRERW